MSDVTHKEIYDRLIQVEQKVDHLDEKTSQVVKAFDAAQGAFLVLDFIGKIARPLLWLIGVGAAIAILWDEFWKRQ
jgi:hypothetical protein